MVFSVTLPNVKNILSYPKLIYAYTFMIFSHEKGLSVYSNPCNSIKDLKATGVNIWLSIIVLANVCLSIIDSMKKVNLAMRKNIWSHDIFQPIKIFVLTLYFLANKNCFFLVIKCDLKTKKIFCSYFYLLLFNILKSPYLKNGKYYCNL